MGVLIAIKGNVLVVGLFMNFVFKFFFVYCFDYFVYFVRCLCEAGFVVVGMMNLLEFGILLMIELCYIGVMCNSWDLERTLGGSFGGLVVAVVSGMLVIAHGNDGGGLLRTLVVCMGLVGFKVSRGCVSCGFDFGDLWLAFDGVVMRMVVDIVYALDVFGGYEVGDAIWVLCLLELYVHLMWCDLGCLRVAVMVVNFFGVDVDLECFCGLCFVVELFVAFGYEVVEVQLVFLDFLVLEIFLQVFGLVVVLGVSYGVLLNGCELGEDDIELFLCVIYDCVRAMFSIVYLGVVVQLQVFVCGIVAFFVDFDVFVMLVLVERLLLIGECMGYGLDLMVDFVRSGRFMLFMSLFNVTGQFVISVLVGFGPDGLLINVQIVGKLFGEDTLLQLVTQIESAYFWVHQWLET